MNPFNSFKAFNYFLQEFQKESIEELPKRSVKGFSNYYLKEFPSKSKTEFSIESLVQSPMIPIKKLKKKPGESVQKF